ncbi:hypothetical protein EJ02DRAFT_228045 [Clathrospora elynae]|uniref:Uncharacterized protein n=1 Tax=Clathrospora elynae TaxID=706981 RepID=A0A6A5SLP2_9PLEO|nr:hypothetical protein EJ02DRAFT_228045 [Clathrospora elynae]
MFCPPTLELPPVRVPVFAIYRTRADSRCRRENVVPPTAPVDLQPGSARRRTAACSLISWNASAPRSSAQMHHWSLNRRVLSLVHASTGCIQLQERQASTHSQARWLAGGPTSATTALLASETKRVGVPAHHVTYPIEHRMARWISRITASHNYRERVLSITWRKTHS